MQLFITHEGETLELTQICGNVSLQTSLDTLGASLSFDLARNYNDINFATCEKIAVGDRVLQLDGDKVLFDGVLLDINTSKFKKSVKCLDYCFYLNKNKVLKQFEEISASVAIKQLFASVNAPVGEVASISTSISKLYNSNTVAEIINDILNQANNELGTRYIIEFEGGKFNIVLFKPLEVEFVSKKTGDESVTESILEMKNKVIVISNEQDEAEILATAQDDKNIQKYGSLQEIISVDPDEDEAKARNIATTKLKELNKVFKTATLKAFGHAGIKAGRLVKLENNEFYLQGQYLIKSCTHTWDKGEFITSVEVEQYVE
jgi:hypothetical protein